MWTHLLDTEDAMRESLEKKEKYLRNFIKVQNTWTLKMHAIFFVYCNPRVIET